MSQSLRRAPCRMQAVAAQCATAHGAEAEVLPLDLCSPYAELHKAAVSADAAFDGAGVDYLLHNAGMWGHFDRPTVLPGPLLRPDSYMAAGCSKLLMHMHQVSKLTKPVQRLWHSSDLVLGGKRCSQCTVREACCRALNLLAAAASPCRREPARGSRGHLGRGWHSACSSSMC